MDSLQIKTWSLQLIKSYGEPRKVVDTTYLRKLYCERQYTQMVGTIAAQLALNLTIRVGLVNSGGIEDACAWVDPQGLRGLYGTPEFRDSTIVVYLRRAYLEEVTFAEAVRAVSHELSHVVLDATAHPLRNEEKVVDLAVMHFGYRSVMQRRYVALGANGVPKGIHVTGYLTEEEIAYAKALMQT